MRDRRHRLRPLVEPLESKALLSGAIAGSSVAAAVQSPLIRVIHLNGTFRGHYHVNASIPDVGRGVQERVAAYLDQMANVDPEAVDVIVDQIGPP